jgi:hypothetical protein
MAMAIDALCALVAGLLAYSTRLDELSSARLYLVASCLLPFAWLAVVAMVDGYDTRFIGVGSNEFRRVLNAGLILTAAIAFTSYAAKVPFARGYVVVALPSLTVLDLVARYALRKRLTRSAGSRPSAGWTGSRPSPPTSAPTPSRCSRARS